MTSSSFDVIAILPPYLAGNDKFTGLMTRAGINIRDISGEAHAEFNYILCSMRADAVLILVDATFGLEKRSLWAKSLACLAAIPNIIITIDNKAMVDYSRQQFDAFHGAFSDAAREFDCPNLQALPSDIAAGDNLRKPSQNMSWYKGPTLLDCLEKHRQKPKDQSVRMGNAQTSDQFAVHLCWLSASPMLPGRQYIFDNGDQKHEANISALKYRLNPETMEHQAAKRLFAGNIGYGNLSLDTAISFAPFEENREAGSFTLKDKESGEMQAFGLIKHSLRRATNIRWQQVYVDKQARSDQKRQKPFVLWFTGLSGSGKSTIAALVEKNCTLWDTTPICLMATMIANIINSIKQGKTLTLPNDNDGLVFVPTYVNDTARAFGLKNSCSTSTNAKRGSRHCSQHPTACSAYCLF